MKQTIWLMTVVALITVCLAGCKRKDEVNIKKLQDAFKTADASTQSTVNNAIVDIESVDYTEALNKLKKLGTSAKLTPEQQQAVKDAIEQVTKKMGASAEKAVGEVQKSMPK